MPGPGVEIEDDVAHGERRQARREQVPGRGEGRSMLARAREDRDCRADADQVVEERLPRAVPRQQEVQPDGCEAREEVHPGGRQRAKTGGSHSSLRCLSATEALTKPEL